MTTPLEEMANRLNGIYIDYDGAPPNQPYQCHDMWLGLLVLLDIPIRLGWAPGYFGLTYEVWKQFPAVLGLEEHFVKHGGHAIQAGDAVFWPVSARYPGTHVAVALGPVSPVDGTFPCLTQNPGPATITRLSAEGAAGFLRPIDQSINGSPAPLPVPPRDRRKPVAYITGDTNSKKKPQGVAPGGRVLLMTGDAGTAITKSVGDYQITASVVLTGDPGTVVTLTAYRYVWDGSKYTEYVYLDSNDVTIGASGTAHGQISIANRVSSTNQRIGVQASVPKSAKHGVRVNRYAWKGHQWEI